MSLRKRWLPSIIILCIVFLGIWSIISPRYKTKLPPTTVATIIKPAKVLTTFNLQASTGAPFTLQSLRGYWTLMFFGYPNCPDICPRTLGLVRDAWNSYTDPNNIPAHFVFVNISPTQIPVLELNSFVQNYHPTFLGVTGSAKQLAELTDQLGIFYRQDANKIDHSAVLMLIDPQGHLRAIFSPPFTAEEIAQDLKQITTAIL